MPTSYDPASSKLAFLTIDNHQRRLNADSLQWLALTPIKGSDNITVSYIHGQNRQCEHTVTAACAQDIERWITFTEAFNREGNEWDRRTDMKSAPSPGQQAATAQIDVALEQVILLARECGKSEEFASDIAGPLKLLLRLMIRDQFIAASLENRERFLAFSRHDLGEPYRSKPLVAGIVKDGKTLGGLPVEHKMRPGETPFGYVVGYLSKPALECLQDVVSHASDIRSALSARRLKGRDQDREELPIDAVYPTEPGNEESYWVKQQHDHERLVRQAQEALDIHAKVSGK